MIIALCPFPSPRMPSESHSASSSAALVFDAVFLSELFYSAGGVDKFLFAGKERVAIGANFHMDIAHRGTGFDHMPTGTSNCRRLIFRMDTCLHKLLSNMKFYNITMGSLQTHARRKKFVIWLFNLFLLKPCCCIMYFQ